MGGASEGNRLTLYTDGDEAFDLAFEAIRSARKRVWLETYILEPDEVGRPAIEAMAEAARRGCDVILLFDRFGSRRIGARHTAPIWKAGGRVAMYNPLLPWRKRGRRIAPFFYRDHRKILIADEVGFCGGRNVSVEYGGPGPERFYDMTLRLEGPCVRDLASVLLDSLYAATHDAPPLPPAPAPLPGGVFAEVFELNARKQERDLDEAVLAMLRQARRHCYLTTPYFVPPAWFLQALGAAARRGVDVRVLTAGISDLPHARTAGRHIYGRLLSAGGRIYELQHPTLHAKNLTVDGSLSLVTSYNFDQYGARHNLEVGVMAPDPTLAQALEAEFFSNLERSEEVSLDAWLRRPLLVRFFQWLLYRLAHL